MQIGITLIGILAGAYSGASLGGPVGARLAPLGLAPETAATLGFVIVIVLTTYASLVIGELVPKQFALALARADRRLDGAADAVDSPRRRRRSSGCSTAPARSSSGCSGCAATMPTR